MFKFLLSFLAILFISSNASALDYLVLCVDISSSIRPNEYKLQKEAYVEVLNDPDVSGIIGDGLVAIIEFGTDAYLVTDFIKPTEAAKIYSKHKRPSPSGHTGIGDCLEKANKLLSNKNGIIVVDVSGDGWTNIHKEKLEPNRQLLQQKNVQINGLVIPTGDLDSNGNSIIPKVLEHYETKVKSFDGFVLVAANREDFNRALKAKIVKEIVMNIRENNGLRNFN